MHKALWIIAAWWFSAKLLLLVVESDNNHNMGNKVVVVKGCPCHQNVYERIMAKNSAFCILHSQLK